MKTSGHIRSSCAPNQVQYGGLVEFAKHTVVQLEAMILPRFRQWSQSRSTWCLSVLPRWRFHFSSTMRYDWRKKEMVTAGISITNFQANIYASITPLYLYTYTFLATNANPNSVQKTKYNLPPCQHVGRHSIPLLTYTRHVRYRSKLYTNHLM